MNNSVPDGDLEMLDRILDTYGADRTRWPADVRLALSRLIGESTEAQRRLSEAAMFDRMLDQAPGFRPERHAALVEQIVSAAERSPRVAHTAPAGRIVAPARKLSIGRREYAFAATALAASLVLGVIAGQTTAIGPAAQALLSSASDGISQQMAQTDDSDSLVDEDLL